MNRILDKVFVQRFYSSHAGMFIFAALILIGCVEPGQLILYQYTLVIASVTSLQGILIVFLFWFLYTAKTVVYTYSIFNKPDTHFLYYSISSANRKKQFLCWFKTQLKMNLPTLIYAAAMVFAALQKQLFFTAILVIAFQFLISYLPAYLYRERSLVLKNEYAALSLSLHSFYNIQLSYLFKEQKLAFVITKLMSYGLITGIFWMFKDVNDNMKVVLIALLAVSISHAVFVFGIRKFQEQWLLFRKNLPFSRFKILWQDLAVILTIIIPEISWLFSRFSWETSAVGILFLCNCLLYFYALLYIFPVDMETYMKLLLITFLLFLILILFQAALYLSVLIMIISPVVFYKKYYRTEVRF